MPTQKSAGKWQLRTFTTSCAKYYEGHSLVQTSFPELPKSALIFRADTICGRLKNGFPPYRVHHGHDITLEFP